MNIIQTIKRAFQPSNQDIIASVTEAIDKEAIESGSIFVLTQEQYFAFRDAFKAKAKAKQITAADIILYNIIRGKEPKRGFTPITNPKKLANGMFVWSGYKDARRALASGLEDPTYFRGTEYGSSIAARKYRDAYGDMLTPNVCAQIRAILKEAK